MTALAETGLPARAIGDDRRAPIHDGFEPAGYARSVEGKLAVQRIVRSVVRSAVKWPGRAWGALDLGVAAASFFAAHHLSPRFAFEDAAQYSIGIGIAMFAASMLFFSYVLAAYDRHNFMFLGRMAGRAVAVSALALALTSLAFGWFGYVQIGRFIVLNTFIMAAGGTFLCRMTAREMARHAKIRLVLAGPKDKFRPLVKQIRHMHAGFYERPIYLSFDTDVDDRACQRRVTDLLNRDQPDEVIVMDDDPSVDQLLRDSQRILRSGCAIFSYSAYYEQLLREVPVDSIDHRGVLGAGFNVGSLHTGLVKRPMDVILASFGLMVGVPLMLLVCLLVKATSRGPIIYKQVRVGRYGRLFWIYKFRTMRTDAEANGAVWAKAGDCRVTPIGTFLRRSRLDELPQLWNILCGEMSLVGLRLQRPEFVAKLREQVPHYELRHLVPPGLTGWAQVRFRYGATVEDAQRKLAFDLYYVRNCGLIFDAAICLRTLVAMAKGAR